MIGIFAVGRIPRWENSSLGGFSSFKNSHLESAHWENSSLGEFLIGRDPVGSFQIGKFRIGNLANGKRDSTRYLCLLRILHCILGDTQQ